MKLIKAAQGAYLNAKNIVGIYINADSIGQVMAIDVLSEDPWLLEDFADPDEAQMYIDDLAVWLSSMGAGIYSREFFYEERCCSPE